MSKFIYFIFLFLSSPAFASEVHSEKTTIFINLPFLNRIFENHESTAIVSSTWVIMILVWVFFYKASSNLKIIPGKIQGIAESIVIFIYDFLKEQLDERRAEYCLSFVLSIALFVFFGNFLGLVPGIEGTTANWSTTAALAITVFLYYNFMGIKEMGVLKHIGHFFGPKLPWYLKPINLFLFPIELIGHLARPLSLSLRLAGNMTGGHTVIAIFLTLTAVPLIYPIPLMGLEFIAAIVQTFIFVLLSTIYVKLATDHTEE